MILCCLCNESGPSIVEHLKKDHKLTITQYRQIFSEMPVSENPNDEEKKEIEMTHKKIKRSKIEHIWPPPNTNVVFESRKKPFRTPGGAEVKGIIVNQMKYCSKASFYRYAEELRKENKIEYIQVNEKTVVL